MSSCVTREQLEQLVNGQLNGQDHEIVAAHVQDCAPCQQVLDELTRAPRPLRSRESESHAGAEEGRLLESLSKKGPRVLEVDHEGKQSLDGSRLNHEGDGPSIDTNDAHRSGSTARFFPVIQGFKFIREIGRGGMGAVYEADEEILGRRVALKVLPGGAANHPKHVERFRREAKAAARLHHTNIVPVFGVGECAGQPYYVMEYIDGQGLDIVLKELRRLRQKGLSQRPGASLLPSDALAQPDIHYERQVEGPASSTAAGVAWSLASGQFERPGLPLPVRERPIDAEDSTAILAPPMVSAARLRVNTLPVPLEGSSEFSSHSNFSRPYFLSVARIGLQAAEALDYANRQGVLHRDIKPSNLLLDATGSIRITDFGLAKITDSDDLTDTGDLIGTLYYMAPERFQGRCDVRSDVYSLGLTLYELVALRRAYEAADRHELLEKVLHKEPERLNKLAPKVPCDLETIIRKAIAREPARRYAAAAEFADDLRRFLDGRTILARRASAAERSVRWCRRNPWVAVSLALLILGTALSGWQAVRATFAERSARRAEASALTERSRAESEAELARRAEASALTERERAENEADSARRAEASAVTERKRAENEAEISKAVKEFLNKDVLAQASVDNQAVPGTKPDPNITVRTALDRAAAVIGEKFKGQPLVEASIRLTIGETYQQLGLFKEALPQLRLAHELRRRVLGDDDPETLMSLCSIGRLLLGDDKCAEAEPLLLQAMHGLKRTRGTRRTETLEAMNAVAQLYRSQDKLTDAEELLVDIVEGFHVTGNDQLPAATSALNDLGMIYLDEKKLEQSEQILTRVVDISRKNQGVDHTATLTAMGNLALVYGSQRKHEQAQKILEQVLERQRKLLGSKHPTTLTTMIGLGEILLARSKLAEAETLLIEALAGCRDVVDGQHIMTDAALALLSAVYVMQRDLKKLGPVLMESREITRARWGPDAQLTADADRAAGLYCINQKDFAKAESYFRERLAFLAKHKPDDWTRFVTESLLGFCLVAEKKYVEAETLLLSAHDGINPRAKRLPPAEQAELRTVIERIQQLYDLWGKKEKSAQWRDRRSDLGFPDNTFSGH
jgi:eukaryotic-like serine/threonine-protein kinase